MNRKQKVCLWIGIIIVVIMGIFPPWVRRKFYGGIDYSKVTTIAYRYSFIASPPKIAAFVDLYRLGVQWAMVTVITGGLIYTFKDQKDKKTKPSKNNK